VEGGHWIERLNKRETIRDMKKEVRRKPKAGYGRYYNNIKEELNPVRQKINDAKYYKNRSL
jgi:hypothetical protein